MKKSLRTVLIACLLVSVIVVLSACGANTKIAKGTYKVDAVQINGKTVAIPNYDAMPALPAMPAILPEEPWDTKPDPGTAPVEPDYSSMTENKKIVARAEFALAKAEWDAEVIRAEAWQAQKDAYDAIVDKLPANAEAWDLYSAQMTAHSDLMDAWEINCRIATYNALKAAGVSAYVAENVSEAYQLFMILKTLEIGVNGNVVSFKNFDAVNDMINSMLGMVASGTGLNIALEYVELTFEVNSDGCIILSVGASGMRVGVSASALTYKDGKINFEINIGDVALKIVFKK